MAPYKSKAQQRYFHYLENEGKLPKKTVDEFDEATDFDDLPEEVEKYSHGGMVDENFDYIKGHETSFDSSGEPDTEFDEEDEHPMEYMNRGGRVRMYSKGGYVPSAALSKALRKPRF